MNQNASGDTSATTTKTPPPTTTTTQNSNNGNNSNRGAELKSPTTAANNTNNSNSSNNSASSPTTGTPPPLPRTPDQVTDFLRLQGAIPVTIQARAELLRDALPHNSWLPEYQWVVEGRQVGYALRLTGNDLVYVKFPIIKKNAEGSSSSNIYQQPPSHLICVSFAVPKKFLVPVTTPAFPSSPVGPQNHQQQNSMSTNNSRSSNENTKNQNLTDNNNKINNNNNNNNCVALTALLAEMTIPGKNGNGGAAATSSSASNGVNNNNNNSSKPCLCVVCGVWNTDGGQMRKSGFKCKNCIGKQSTARLKEAYSKLATESDE